MFLIQCSADQSLCIVKESNVICDENVVKNGDSVTFYWNKKSYVGQILNRSDDSDILEKELRKVQKAQKVSKKPVLSRTCSDSLGKRKSQKPRSFSPSDNEVMDAKKKVKNRAHKATKSAVSKEENKKTSAQKIKIKKKNRPKTATVSDSSDTSVGGDENNGIFKKNLSDNARSLHQNTTSAKSPLPRAKSPTKEELIAMLKKYQQSSSTPRKNSTEHTVVSQVSGLSENQARPPKVATPKSSKILEDYRSQSVGSPTGKKGSRNVTITSDDSSFNNCAELQDLCGNSNDACGNISLDEDSDSRNDAIANDGTKQDGRRNNTVEAAAASNELPTSDDDEDQLFGQHWAGDHMIHLHNGVYCKKRTYKMAIGSSHLATHVARKLIEGVFKPEYLVKCTLTGQSARAQGKDRQIEVSSLHEGARDAIIEFAKSLATKRQWAEQDERVIKKAMSQKLVEIKQAARKNSI